MRKMDAVATTKFPPYAFPSVSPRRRWRGRGRGTLITW
jgi:hypothetical protein